MRVALALRVVAVCFLPAAAIAGDLSTYRVRINPDVVPRDVMDSMSRSPTLQSLVSGIADTDVIVYVELIHAPQVRSAETRLVTSAAGTRYLRVLVSASLPPIERAAFVAHELQHVLEISTAREVRDAADLARLYRGIGFASSRKPSSFETRAAQTVQARARREILRALRSPGSER
jgi:hypothetical protein